MPRDFGGRDPDSDYAKWKAEDTEAETAAEERADRRREEIAKREEQKQDLREDGNLVELGEMLREDYTAMLGRNRGEYPATGIAALHDRPSNEDKETMDELREFFNKDCRDIPSIEVGQGGNYDRDELKRLSDTLYLLRTVRAEYDADLIEYSIIDRKEATERLEGSIERRKQEIAVLEAKNRAVQELLDEMK